MPLYSIDGPDGHTYEIEGPEGATREQIIAQVQAQLQQKPQEDPSKQGLMAAMNATAARGQAGMARLFGRGDLGEQLEKYAGDTYQPTQQSWTEAPWEKFKESAGEAIPGLVGVVGGSVVGGPLGAAAMGATMGAGQNVERQVAPTEQGGAGRTQDQIDRTSALGWAIPEGALNAIGVRMLPGVKSILGEAFGHAVPDAVARQVAKQGLAQTAKDLAISSGVGATDMGLMGVANSFMERLQAGLDTTDPQARDEYLHSLIGGAAFGALVGPGGRMMERAGLKAQAERADRADEAAQQQQQDAQDAAMKEVEQQRRQTPEFAQDAQQRYEALQKQWAQLEEATKVKPEKDDFAGQQQLKDARAALREFRDSDEFKQTVTDYLEAKPQLDAAAKAKAQAAEDAKPQSFLTPTDQSTPDAATQAQTFADSLAPQIKKLRMAGDEQGAQALEQKQQEALSSVQQPEEPKPSYQDWQGALDRVSDMITKAQDQNKALHEAGATMDERLAAAQKLTQLNDAYQRMRALNVPEPTNPAERIPLLEKKVQKAVDKGESPEQYLREIQDLQRQQDLFRPQERKPLTGSTLGDQQLADEMGQGREEGNRAALTLQKEIEALQRIGDKRPTSPEYLQALDTAMGNEAGFMPPQPPSSTLSLTPDQSRIAQLQKARAGLSDKTPATNSYAVLAAMQRLKQKEGSTAPMDSWLAAKRQQLIEQRRQQLDEIAGKYSPIGQQTELGAPSGESPINLSDESDKRISSLIDHYLPQATPKPGQATPATDMNLRGQLKAKIAQAQRIKHDAFLELADFYQNVVRDNPNAYMRGHTLRKRFIDAAVAETDLRRQAAGGEPMPESDKQDLRDILHNVASDMARLAITRNEHNSYKYGQVQGFVDGFERKPGAMTPEQASELQNELQYRRQRAMALQAHIDRQKFIQSIGNGREAAVTSAPVQQLHRLVNANEARISEITHLLAAHIRGEDMQSVVIPKQVRGSNAQLGERALGSPGHAVQVLEEEVQHWMDAYTQAAKPREQEPAQRPTPRVIKADQRAPALTNFELLEQVRSNAQKMRELEGLLKEPANNLEQGTTHKALRAELEHLRQRDAQLREKYNATEATDTTEEAMGRRLNRAMDQAELHGDTKRLEVLRRKWGEWAARTYRPDESEPVRPSYSVAERLYDRASPNAQHEPPAEGQRSLFHEPKKPFETKAPEPKALTDARTRMVAAQTEVEKLRNAASEAGFGERAKQAVRSEVQRPQIMKQVAQATAGLKRAEASLAASQKKLANLQKRWDSPETPSARLDNLKAAIDKAHTDVAEREADLAKAKKDHEAAKVAYTNFERVRASAEPARVIQQKLLDAQRRLDRAKSEVAHLEQRAGRAEQLKAAKSGRELGDIEADRINAGTSDRYRNYKGEKLAGKPVEAKATTTHEPENSLLRTEAEARRQTGEIADREGKTLLGERHERDTSGKIMTAEANTLKKQLARIDNTIDKAKREGNRELEIKAEAAKKRVIERLDQQYERAPTKTTELGGEKKAAAAPKVQEGTRLPVRKQGPLVRNISGDKRAQQSGAPRLYADGLHHEDANAVALYRLKNQLEAATNKKTKAALQKQWDAMTQGVNVEEVLSRGKELSGLGPTDKIIAARQRLREAIEDVQQLEKDLKAAPKGSAERKAIEAKLERANGESDRAEEAYKTAKDEHAASQVKAEKEKPEGKKTKKQAKLDAADDWALDGIGETDFDKMAADIPELEADDGPVFRTGTEGNGMRMGDVQRAAEVARKKYPGGPDVVVVKSQDDLPFAVPEGKRVPGAFNDGKVYLVADNLHSPEDVHLTMAHEVAGHYGLRAMLGDGYERTMNALFEGNEQVRAKAAAKMREEGLPRDIATEEVLAEMAETNPQDSALKRAFYAVKRWLYEKLGLKGVSDGEVAQIVANARRYVEEGRGPGGGGGGMTGPVFRTTNPKYDVLVGRNKTASEKWREAKDVGVLNAAQVWGLKRRVEWIDKDAAYEKMVALGEKNKKIDHDTAIQAMHTLRFGANVNQAVGQIVGTGPVAIKRQKLASGAYSETFESKAGPNLKKTFQHIGDGARALGIHPDEGAQLATTLAVGNRAEAIKDGWARLADEVDVPKVKALYDEVKAQLAANPKAKASFEAAMREYKGVNDGLIDFVAQTGAISKDYANHLKALPYAPWYRVDKDGAIKLITDKEKPIVIGNMKDSPELEQMLGGSNKVMNLLESSVKNTYLLSRMAMKNKQAQSMANTLWKLGAVSKMGVGTGPAGQNVLHYKVDGKDHFALVDQDVFGVPAELVAKGMEGIKTTIPAFMKMMSVPAHLVRTFVTRSPVYAVRQMMRDPLNVMFIDGMSPKGVMDAFGHIGKAAFGAHDPVEEKLMNSLAITSNIYANDAGDITKFLQQAASGNGNAVNKFFRRLDEFAQQADAATRQALYTDGIKRGLSDAEAQLRTLESMNFNRRGLSPSMQMASTIIPFFNAQVQGLDVLYRAMSGKMPLNDKLDIQRKLYTRGMMLAAGTLAYAAAMRDDPDYRKQKPQDRYQNFLIRTPFTKDFVKVPIPYEMGVIFKALPEAILDAATSDTRTRDAVFGFAHVAANSAPNFEPAGIAPPVMAALNYSGFGPIESQRDQSMSAELRYGDTTPELLKDLGRGGSRLTEELGLPFGVSPKMLEFFVRSYTGTMGIGIMRMLGDPLERAVTGKSEIQRASTTAGDTPFVGGLFTRAEGRYMVDRAYDNMSQIMQAKKTFDELVAQGNIAEAKRFAQDKGNEIAMAPLAGSYRQQIGALAAQERKIKAAPNMSTAQKDKAIEALKKAENELSQGFYKGTSGPLKIEPRASRP